MIDFSRDTTIKLKQTDIQDGEKMVGELLIDGEKVISAYREIRDCVIFTDYSAPITAPIRSKENINSLQ